MRGKYNKNRRILVAGIVIVLALVATVGTIAFVRTRQDVSAAASNVVDLDNNGTSNGENTNNGSESGNGENNATSENQNGNSVIPGTSVDGENNTTSVQNNTSGTGTRRSSNRTNRGLPDTQYFQTEEGERKVSDSFYASWTPLDVNAETEEISKPKIEIHKMSYINDETENDQAIHSVVFNKDYITYKISVKNNGTDNLNNIHIYDNVPEGTELIEVYDDGVNTNGRLTWIKSIKAGEEIIVSFKVRVIFGEDTKGKEIRQIDNTAIVNGKDTETTHNPTIVAEKEVKVISVNGEELDNQIVTPGTRLRYYINLTNTTEYDGTTKITDMIPEGTSLINNTISDNGTLGENNTITWNGIKVLAGETVKVSFDVTVNKGRRETVSNVAIVGSDKPEKPEDPENLNNPDEPDEPTYTNEVKTPVFMASKTSVLDGEKVRETGEVEYIVTVTNTANPNDDTEKDLTGVAKLEDKFWIEDSGNMTFKTGTLTVVNANGKTVGKPETIDEEFLSNIEVELKAGETATIKYTYIVNEMTLDKPEEGILSDEIANNLYWTEPKDEDPSRPDNPNDTTEYKNPEDPDDPTPPEKDPDDSDRPEPIDTVKVTVEEKYIKVEANKIWIDLENKFETRPEEITYTLYQNDSPYKLEDGKNYSITATAEGNWKAIFVKLKETDPNGRKYTYTVQEDAVPNYETTYSNDGLTVKNRYTNPDVTAEKKVQIVTKTEDGTVTTNSLIDNNIVEPGTRLRYTITVTNDNTVDAYVNIEDEIPDGTTLYNNVISNHGTLSKGKVTWTSVKVSANSKKDVYFDVTVNKDTNTTVKNVALVKIPQISEDPETPVPDKEIPTNEVKTPVFVASKTATLDGQKVHEGGEVEYVVTITNTADAKKADEKDLESVAKLEDKFWEEDKDKMTFKTGTLTITDANGKTVGKPTTIDADFLRNIEVKLKAGQKATIKYTYIVNAFTSEIPDSGIRKDELANNLYWAESAIDDPERPVNPNDDGTYERNDPNDPTKPEADPNPEYSTKPGLIDTVIVKIEEPIFTAEKVIVENKGTANENEVKELAVKEKEEINYRITVKNIGNVQGTTAVLDKFKNTDNTKVTFKTGSATIKYYNKISDASPYETKTITENELKNNKIILTIKGGGKAVIEYTYTAKVINKDKTPDSDGVIRESVTNDLYWSKVNNSDHNDPRYPTKDPIDNTVVTLEKVYTEQIATKVWDDSNNAKGKRPASVEFTLKSSDNKVTKTIALKAENKEYTSDNYVVEKVNNNEWKVTFKQLPKYAANGDVVEYTIEEKAVSNYETRSSVDKDGNYTIRNILKEDIAATIITTNEVTTTVPMDIVFVVDISSSMLKDENSSNGKTRIENTVSALNTAINKVASVPGTRVAVQLYNSYVSAMTDKTSKLYYDGNIKVTGDYELVSLGEITKRNDGKYIKYSTSSKKITTNVNDNSMTITDSSWGKNMYIGGTYTQAGIQKGEKLLTGASDKMVSGETYTRIPVMFLITDGCPTLVSPTTAGTTTVKQPAERPNKDTDIWYDKNETTSNKTKPLDFAREKAINWEYFYYTMLQIQKSKQRISTAYSTGSSIERKCRFYTIGIDMIDSSLVDVLLNPSKENINKLSGTETNPGFGEYNTDAKNNTFYNNQRQLLKTKLGSNYTNYTEMSYNGANNLSKLQSQLTEMITNTQEKISKTTVGNDRKINLTGINKDKPFELIISSGKDFDGNNVSETLTFDTFTQALANATVKKYVKGTTGNYYVDLSTVRSGTVKITYGK